MNLKSVYFTSQWEYFTCDMERPFFTHGWYYLHYWGA